MDPRFIGKLRPGDRVKLRVPQIPLASHREDGYPMFIEDVWKAGHNHAKLRFRSGALANIDYQLIVEVIQLRYEDQRSLLIDLATIDD